MNRDHFVYWYYSQDGVLLYIGCSFDVQQRRRLHRSSSAWFGQVATEVVEGPYAFGVARKIEQAAIELSQPPHNLNHTGKPQPRKERVLNGEAVKALRMANGLSVRTFAKEIGRTAGFISRLERGLDVPSVATVEAIASRLGVSAGAITNGRAA